MTYSREHFSGVGIKTNIVEPDGNRTSVIAKDNLSNFGETEIKIQVPGEKHKYSSYSGGL